MRAVGAPGYEWTCKVEVKIVGGDDDGEEEGLGRKVRRAIKESHVEVGEERVVTVSKKEGSNVQFIKMSVDGGRIFIGGSLDACYENTLSTLEERVINKFDFWSILVTQAYVYIGGFKELCVYDVSLGRITKSIKTKDFVYCIF
jgi:hypothetical protein